MVYCGYCKVNEDPFAEDGKLTCFEKWWREYDKKRTDRWLVRDFMMYGREEEALLWYYTVPDDVVIDCDYEIIDFNGGLYAADIAILDNFDDEQRVYGAIKEYIKNSDLFDLDERPGHYDLSHGITPEDGAKAMGHMQLEIYVPIKLKQNPA